MLRVLISTSTFPLRPDDGLPRFVFDLAEALAERCEVTALAPDAPGARRKERLGSVDVRRFSYFYPRREQRLAYGHGMRDNLRIYPLGRLQILPFLLAQVLALRRLVRSERIDVVNSHWIVPQGLSAALVRGSRPRFRHVLSIHAGDVYLLEQLPSGPALARFVLDRTDHVFTAGSEVSKHLDDLLGRPANSVIQPMGVRLELFGSGLEAPPRTIHFPDGYLLFFGRFVEKKGIGYLFQALPKILERHPGLGLVLVGYGILERELRREVLRLGIERSVLFAGRQPHQEIGRFLGSSRLAVVPSIVDRQGETEGMPTVILEAMSSGTRVVASAVDGIPDVVCHGENGWLCRQKDPDDLAEKILIALDDPPTSGVLEGARQTAERHTWPKVAARYLEAFERLTTRRPQSRVP